MRSKKCFCYVFYIMLLVAGMLFTKPAVVSAAGLTAEEIGVISQMEPETIEFVQTSTDLSKVTMETSFSIDGNNPFRAVSFTMDQPGELVFHMEADLSVSDDAIKVEIYNLSSTEKPVIQKQILDSVEECSFFNYFEAGAYAVIFRGGETESEVIGKMSITAYQAGDFTVEEEDANYIGFGNNHPLYVKIPVKTSGRVTITAAMQDGEQLSGIKYAFCDKSKKFLAWGTTESKDNYSEVFCVKKGTYYLKLTPTMGKFKVKFQAVPYDLKNNTSMDRAKKLKAGTYQYLTIPLGKENTEQHYYRFRLKKPTLVKLSADFSGLSGEARFVMYKDQKLVALAGTGVLNLEAGKSFTFQWEDEKGKVVKWPAGEYIIKVGKDREQATNGIVRLKITK